jgi:hypothetical protein
LLSNFGVAQSLPVPAHIGVKNAQVDVSLGICSPDSNSKLEVMERMLHLAVLLKKTAQVVAGNRNQVITLLWVHALHSIASKN